MVFIFVKLCYIEEDLHKTKTADGLNIHSLPVDGTYGTVSLGTAVQQAALA